MPELFISYARDDQDIARRFAEGFEREGFSVWWDQSLNPGEAFDQVTERALEEARAVVVLWSKTSVNSRWVRAEATQASAAGRLLPVMVEACKRPIIFELTHTVDLSGWTGNVEDAAWHAFVASVRRFLQRAAAPPEAGGLRALPARTLSPPPGLWLRAFVQLGSLLRRFGGRLAFGLVCAALAAFVAWKARLEPTPQVARFSIELQDTIGVPWGFAVSPDGRRIVYASSQYQLYSRVLDKDESTPIPGTDSAFSPFFSPDGRTLAYFNWGDHTLKAFDFSTTRELADLKQVPGPAAGTWDDQGRISYGLAGSPGLFRVAGVGGVPENFAKLGDYQDIKFPAALPDGRWVLFAAKKGGTWSEADIVAQDVTSGERKVVLHGGWVPAYLPTGYLLFVRGGTLYAAAFDATHLATRGRAVPVVQNIWTDEDYGFCDYAVSASGTLVYFAGTQAHGGAAASQSLAHVGRDGAARSLSSELRDYNDPRASPDGSKVAVEAAGDDRRTHIWVMDLRKGTATQLNFEGEEDRFPVWTADGREVLFTSRRGTEYAIYRKAADGTGEARLVLRGSARLAPSDVHGRTLIYQDSGEGGQRDIFALDLQGEAKPRTVLATAADESSARISPDGKWMAYVSAAAPGSNGSPPSRVYARPFPNSAEGGQRAVSESAAADPQWSTAGDEIYYLGLTDSNEIASLWSVQVEVTASTITPTGRRALFRLSPRFTERRIRGYGQAYGLLPDGGFVIVANGVTDAPDPASANRARANVVMNWTEELKKLVPVE